MSNVVKIAVTFLVLGLLWIAAFQDSTPEQAWALIADRMDARPAREILVIGNSRTSFNNMPSMLRHIADSAHSPQKFELFIVAPNGASFASLLSDPDLQQQAGKSWDDVIVQGESRGQSTRELSTSFISNGKKLLGQVHVRSGQPRLLVNWAYDPGLYERDDPSGRAEHYEMIQSAHLTLAKDAHAHLVNVGRVWEDMRQKMPNLVLTSDGNHPTPVASYFVALCLYADLSGQDVINAQWTPDGIDAETARRIRDIVSQDRSEL